MSDLQIEFPLYLSNVNVAEKETPELLLTYEGDETLVEKLWLIGKNNGLSNDISKALMFTKKKVRGKIVFELTFPIYEDGEFQAVDEYEGKYIYEPGQAHSIVFRGKGIFLDLRKIYHLKKGVVRPKDAPKAEVVKKEEIEEIISPKIETDVESLKVEETLPPAYDKQNMLKLQPKDFRVFDQNLKNKLLQILDYLSNEKSKKLIHDGAILPDIARSLKQLISEEQRASVYDVCFPVVVLIEKALMLSSMVYRMVMDEETFERYNQEVVAKIDEVKEKIKETEFLSSQSMIKVQYDEDVHELRKRFYREV
ncbi:MAG: hypothetical protein ACTSQE_07890 [Candidatus Heimdallarchaeaceae archaeon]